MIKIYSFRFEDFLKRYILNRRTHRFHQTWFYGSWQNNYELDAEIERIWMCRNIALYFCVLDTLPTRDLDIILFGVFTSIWWFSIVLLLFECFGGTVFFDFFDACLWSFLEIVQLSRTTILTHISNDNCGPAVSSSISVMLRTQFCLLKADLMSVFGKCT